VCELSYYYLPRPLLRIRVRPPRQERLYQPPPERYVYQPPEQETYVEQAPELYYLPPVEVRYHELPPRRFLYQPPPEEYYYQPPPRVQYYQPPPQCVSSSEYCVPPTYNLGMCDTSQIPQSCCSAADYPYWQQGHQECCWNSYSHTEPPYNIRVYDPRTLPIKR